MCATNRHSTNCATWVRSRASILTKRLERCWSFPTPANGLLGMPKGFYPGYDREISEVYVFQFEKGKLRASL